MRWDLETFCRTIQQITAFSYQEVKRKENDVDLIIFLPVEQLLSTVSSFANYAPLRRKWTVENGQQEMESFRWSAIWADCSPRDEFICWKTPRCVQNPIAQCRTCIINVRSKTIETLIVFTTIITRRSTSLTSAFSTSHSAQNQSNQPDRWPE